MASPLDAIRNQCHTPAEAVRWACVLEATAPKVGNVHPGHSFADLTYSHFVTAAEIAADAFDQTQVSTCLRAFDAATRTFEQTNTNVNLGILLLLAPLVAADETGHVRSIDDWTTEIQALLGSLTPADSDALLETIRVASAGGLGKVDEMDVNDRSQQPSDIIAAMRLAEDRDRIALQYASSFQDLVTEIVPVVKRSICEAGDTLTGIVNAQIALLAKEPDSLIARKRGADLAASVQQHAQRVDVADPASVAAFDAFLRSQDHTLNPGTTADLIAAALYVVLRTPPRESTI